MAIGFFQNYRVYILTSVAYMGSLLFGKLHSSTPGIPYLSTSFLVISFLSKIAMLTPFPPTGYDTGVMSSVLSLKSFKEDFNLPTATTGFASKTNAHISQNVVSLLTAGCFFGAIFASAFNDKFGRKISLIGFTWVFLLGAIIQVTSLHHISQMYGGRFVAGLGIGGVSSISLLIHTCQSARLLRNFLRVRLPAAS
jgi:MFS family permease